MKSPAHSCWDPGSLLIWGLLPHNSLSESYFVHRAITSGCIPKVSVSRKEEYRALCVQVDKLWDCGIYSNSCSSDPISTFSSVGNWTWGVRREESQCPIGLLPSQHVTSQSFHVDERGGGLIYKDRWAPSFLFGHRRAHCHLTEGASVLSQHR